MTSRERLLAALKGKEVDRLPFAPLADGYFVSSLPERGYNFDLLEALDFIGCDILERHVYGADLHFDGFEWKSKQEGNEVTTYYDTPVGYLFEKSKISGKTRMITKHYIETPEEAKIFKYIAEHTTFTPNNEAFVKRDKEIGDRGLATLSGNMSPIQDILQFLCGIENTVYLLNDEPEIMEDLMNSMHERNLRQYKALTEVDCPVVFDYEDTSTTVMSKDMFTKYSAPCINDYAKLLHKSGKSFITHMCGKLTGFANEIASLQMDGIDSVCPPTTGDLYPWDARKYFGKKIIIGGIEPPSLVRMSKDETVNTVAEIIKRMPTLKGFILSTGDAVPYGAPIENLKAISDYIKNLGKNSLNSEFVLTM